MMAVAARLLLGCASDDSEDEQCYSKPFDVGHSSHPKRYNSWLYAMEADHVKNIGFVRCRSDLRHCLHNYHIK